MLNLEKHLNDIQIKHNKPSQKLIDDTIFEIHKLNGRRGMNWDWLFNVKTIAAFSLSVATLLIMLSINFNMTPVDVTKTAHAFYSIDINPSVVLSVDDKEYVTNVEALNEDATKLLQEIDLIGLHSRQAITKFVELAQENGYLTAENKYVLIGRFGDDNSQVVPEMQEYFEENFEAEVQILVVSGSIKDKEEADKNELSPGILELSNTLQSETPGEDDNIAQVIEGANQEAIDLPAVEISLAIEENIFTFNFNQLSFNSEDYEGTVVYKLVRAKTVEEIADLDYEVVLRRTYYSTEELPTSFEIEALLREYHYAIIVEYEGGIKKFSNMIYIEADKYVDDAPKYIEGVKVENSVKLVWTKAVGGEFEGYRIVASNSDANPKYPEVDSIIYVTDIDTTTLVIEPGQYGLDDETEYNFSVTYIYNDDTRYANTVAVTTGKKVVEPDPEPDPTPTPVVRTKADITSSTLEGYKIYLNWHKIEKSNFKGYKVVYSFTDSTPVYGESGTYYYTYITDRNTTSSKIDLSQVAYRNSSKSQKVYVSVTALYEGEPNKVAGNVKVHNVPEALLVQEEPVASNIIEHDLKENYDVLLKWEQIDLLSLEGYKVVYSFTDSTPVYGESGTNYKYWLTNKADTQRTINLSDIIEKNTTGSNVVYFSITSLYNNHSVKKPGNVIMIEIPEALRESPEEPEEPIATNIIEHNLRENRYLDIAWNKIELSSLEGYKVVYSFTDSTPVYGESETDYIYWIQDKSVVSKTIDLSTIMENNTTGSDVVYVSITALYNDHSIKKAGDPITVNIPESLLPQPGVATTILSATLNDEQTSATIVVEEISNPRFTKHKVYYSFTDSAVSDGTHYKDMTGSNMSFVFADLIENSENSTVVYIKVTTLYGNPIESYDSTVFTLELPTE